MRSAPAYFPSALCPERASTLLGLIYMGVRRNFFWGRKIFLREKFEIDGTGTIEGAENKTAKGVYILICFRSL